MALADVIMLAHTADKDAWDMTVEALSTLRSTTPNIHVIVVESATTPYGHYHVDKVISPNESFNYNRFLNFGLSQRSGAPYTVILNNDLVFHQLDWLKHVLHEMYCYNLDSASPVSPGWHCHNNIPRHGVIEGYRTSFEFCGWCLVFRTASLARLLPLDERFSFEWQDVDLAKRAQDMGQKHGLVLHSEVIHLLNQSHRFIPAERRAEMIDNARKTYSSIHNQL